MTHFRTFAPGEADNRRTTYVGVYDGLNELAGLLEGFGDPLRMGYTEAAHGGNSWAGRSWPAALTALRDGDRSYVARSDAMLAALEDAVAMATPKREWRASVTGPRLHVGNYLAGAPEICQRRVSEPHDFAPMTCVVSTVCSAGVSGAQLEARGVAVLALLRGLCAVRPVTLYTMSASLPGMSNASNVVGLCKVDTAPLSLAHAAFLLCDKAASRRIGWAGAAYSAIKQGADRWTSNGYVNWYDGDMSGCEARERTLVDNLFPNDQVLYVAPVSLGNAGGIDRNPTQWVRDMLAEYGVPSDD